MFTEGDFKDGDLAVNIVMVLASIGGVSIFVGLIWGLIWLVGHVRFV